MSSDQFNEKRKKTSYWILAILVFLVIIYFLEPLVAQKYLITSSHDQISGFDHEAKPKLRVDDFHTK